MINRVSSYVEDGGYRWTRRGSQRQVRWALASQTYAYTARGVRQAFAERWVFYEEADNSKGEDAVEGCTRRARGMVKDIGS